jgi:hypothetical protein
MCFNDLWPSKEREMLFQQPPGQNSNKSKNTPDENSTFQLYCSSECSEKPYSHINMLLPEPFLTCLWTVLSVFRDNNH